MSVTGDIPPALYGATMQEYEGMLYLMAGEIYSENKDTILFFTDTYKLDLASLVWTKMQLLTSYENRLLTGSSVINSNLILLYGWSDILNGDTKNIMYLSLSNPIGWKEAVLTSCMNVDSFGYATSGSDIYIFGGYMEGTYLNNMTRITNWECITLNGIISTPPARMYSAMASIGTKMYMYGGQGLGGAILEDIWTYDTDSMEWSSFTISGISPGGRYAHAMASDGDVMVVFGGISSLGYLNDMYQFSAYSMLWKLITPTGSSPSGRSGACMSMKLPKIYIYGGETTSGLSQELWEYDTSINEFTLLYSGEEQGANPTPVSFPYCEIVDGNFLLAFGTADGEVPLSTVYLYDTRALEWSLLFCSPFSLFSRSLAAVQYLNGTLLVIGGQAWSTDPYNNSYLLNIVSGEQTYLAALPEYYYGRAVAFYKTGIYMFGGGCLIGTTMRVAVPSYNFYKYELADFGSPCPVMCSPGSYMSNGSCLSCPMGTYNEEYGQDQCLLCPAGTYNIHEGASSARQCYPCDWGSYSPNPGARACFICPYGSYCPVGSSGFFAESLTAGSTSSQPPNYAADLIGLSNNKNYLYIAISLALLGTMVALWCSNAFRNSLIVLDLYKFNHNYILNQPMIMKKNKTGGFFSIMFMLVAILLIVSALLDFTSNNIIESKALVPLVILENIVSNFQGSAKLDFTFSSYGGSCIDSSNNTLATVTHSNINFTSVTIIGSISGQDCRIKILCEACGISTGGYVQISFQEKNSYCSALKVSVTTDSSIPLHTSSISETVVASGNTVFRGYNATQFNVLVTPSLFEPSASSSLPMQTGYHLSIDSSAVPGTEFEIPE